MPVLALPYLYWYSAGRICWLTPPVGQVTTLHPVLWVRGGGGRRRNVDTCQAGEEGCL